MKAKDTLRQYSCGNCGETKHELYEHAGDIITVCSDCQNESRITFTQPKLDIKWVDDNDGLLAL